MAHGTILQFQQLQSAVDLSFWTDFTRLKLHTLKLSEEAVPLQGYYTASGFAELPAPFQLDSLSLDHASNPAKARVRVPGELLNLNTLDSFKNVDRIALLCSTAARIWADIKSGAAERDPSLLCRFLLLSHAELKSYRFYYWFAFPALKPPSPFTTSGSRTLRSALGESRAGQVTRAAAEWLAHQHPQPAFFLIDNCKTPGAHPLSAWEQVRKDNILLAMIDPGNLPGNAAWPLRNLLLLAAVRWGVQQASVVCLRLRGGRPSEEHSLLLEATWPPTPADWGQEPGFVPKAVGWELNAKQKLGPRMADLGSAMDPARLAESAADLNIRLMKWRAAPSLDIDRLSATRCLLLGAGTLGCAVARTLLGWGVRGITLVDNSRVSHSNPVRQSLYEFDDCREGGAPKAAAAAAKLRAIFPRVSAEAVEMSIPMPGHPLSPAEIPEAQQSAEKLEALVASHDVVFLLMDTRESRWLPTLLCAAHNKLAINAALGFDSFLVMRHGAGPSDADEAGPSSRLGCYYCNDVVAPLNSTVDRTLDQQCTVARPGLAPIAGALAVELMAAVMQHPEGVATAAAGMPAVASTAGGSVTEPGPLGAAPHMIRGQLSSFSQLCLTGQAFRQCTACSATVVKEYRRHGWSWLLQALQDPKKLEDLTGLTELLNSTALRAAELDSDAAFDFADQDDDEFVTL